MKQSHKVNAPSRHSREQQPGASKTPTPESWELSTLHEINSVLREALRSEDSGLETCNQSSQLLRAAATTMQRPGASLHVLW